MNLNSLSYTHIDNVFLLADIHMGVRNSSHTWMNNQLDFFYKQVIPDIEFKCGMGEKCLLIVCGDMFESRQYLEVMVMCKTLELIKDFSKLVDVIILQGNHDIYKRDFNDVHSLSIFDGMENVYIINSPTEIQFRGYKTLCIPWQSDHNKEQQLYSLKGYKYMFGHTTINGLRMDNNMPISGGVDVDTDAYVISGHIHKHQMGSNAMYIGSPYEMKRSDKNSKHGYCLLNIDECSISIVENVTSPKFTIVSLDFILESTIDEIAPHIRHNYNDIVVREDMLSKFNLVKFVDILKHFDIHYMNVEVIVNKDTNQLFALQTGNDTSENKKTIKQIIDEYIETLPIKQSLKNRVIDRNKELYEEARDLILDKID